MALMYGKSFYYLFYKSDITFNISDILYTYKISDILYQIFYINKISYISYMSIKIS